MRAGVLQDRTTCFRNDLAESANAAVTGNPHTFLTNIGTAATAGHVLAAKTQIVAFFRSNGSLTIDRDGPGPFFEVPINLPLPEGLNYLP